MASLKIKQDDGTYKKIKLSGDVIQNVQAGEGVSIDDNGVISAEITSANLVSKIKELFTDGEETEY